MEYQVYFLLSIPFAEFRYFPKYLKKTISQNNSPKISLVKAKFTRLTMIWFVLGIVLGGLTMFLIHKKTKSSVKQTYKQEREGGFRYINPLLDCDNFQSSDLRKHANLKEDINQYISEAKKDKKVSHVAVYFRDLNNGPWIGINEFEYFTPASLLKIPIVMAVLKKAESNPGFLQNQIAFEAPPKGNYVTNIGDKIKIKQGETYTVEQLIEYTLMHSDNNAKDILEWFIGPAYVDSVYLHMGVNVINRDKSADFVNIKEYSSFFRILYNASFLSREHSEKTLELLSNIEFNDGIPSKLPKDIAVSHKYGERGYRDSNIKQLHDCGIVYAKNNPYLICIMTKGDDFKNLTDFIAGLSELVYKTIE